MKIQVYVILLAFYFQYATTSENYDLSGFISYESIPVNFPKDICIFKIDDVKFAAALHYRNDRQLEFLVFKHKNGSYAQIYNRITPLAIDMDCISMGSKAYIAFAYNFMEPIQNIRFGAPVFEITMNDISVMQFFVSQFQNSVYLRRHNSTLFLIQAHRDENSDDTTQCPIFELYDYHFNFKHTIPCTNAKYIEPFIVDHTVFVMVAIESVDDEKSTKSILYKYHYDQKEFLPHQIFQIGDAVQMKYFSIEKENKLKEHFIIMTSSVSLEVPDLSYIISGPSIIYKYSKGTFEPFQKLYFHNVTGFLPIYSRVDKFVLLVSCKDQDTKFLRYNGQKFEISHVQLTGGALSNGVVAMRSFEDFNATYIVIANENMQANQTNIYLPLYKTIGNSENARQEMLERFGKLYEKLTNETKKINNIEAVARSFAQGIGYFLHADVNKVDTKMILSSKYNMTKSKWKKLAIASQSILKLEEKLSSLIHENTQNSSESVSTYESLNLNTLTVTNRLDVTSVNNKTLNNIKLDKIIADEIFIKGTSDIKKMAHQVENENTNRSVRQSDFQEIRAKHITTTGTVNGLNLIDFENRIMKKNGDQIIKAPFEIGKIDANDIHVNGTINGESLSKLITINGGSFVVDQDIVFTQTPHVNRLVVNDRLNHINVVQGRLEVLMKNSSDVQMIEGKKTFENVRLMEPFLLRGKIYSPQLNKINPVAFISDNLTLDGNYEIFGQVLVTNRIAANNFFGELNQRNLLEVMENGLSVNTQIIHQSINFQTPIQTENVKVSFLNDIDIKDFLHNRMDKEQTITGVKTFNNDVHIIKGDFHVENINNINLRELHEGRLQRYGDQTITGTLQFNKISIPQFNSTSNVFFNTTHINDILTTTTPQTLANITIENLKVDTIKINKITTTQKIFNNDLDFIINDTIITGESATITGYKIFTGNLTARELSINDQINHIDINMLMGSFQNLNDDVVIDYDVNFDDDIEIESLTLEGEINGLSSRKLGTCWLLIEGDQTFTAPQTFDKFNARNMYIENRVNNQSVNELFSRVYWLDREEIIPEVTFAKLVSESDMIVDGHINGMKFKSSVLLNESLDIQTIEAPVTCEGDIVITGQVKEISIFNNIDFVNLKSVLSGKTKNAKLSIDTARFEVAPKFIYLNGRNLKELLENVWLDNEDTIIGQSLIFSDVELESNVDLNGPVNDVDLSFLNQNYFSLSKAQKISTPMIFKGPVTFEQSLSSEAMTLDGMLVDTISQRSLNFTEFVLYNLRKDSDQNITGKWNISTLIVQGDLNNVQINGLNLFNDVLRNDVNYVQNITAPKQFRKVRIDDLEHSSKTKINGIDMIDWMRKSVLTRGDFTIARTTTFDDLTIRNDVKVLGNVNGVKFDEKHLLLIDTDQIVHGNVTIKTKIDKNNQILPLTVENLEVNAINNVPVANFFKNILPKGDQLKLEGNYAFETAPVVKKFDSKQNIFDLSHLTKNTSLYVERLVADYATLQNSLKAKSAFLSHYSLKQSEFGNIQKVLHLNVQTDDLIAILRGDNELNITFHKWDKQSDQFDLKKELFTWSAKNSTIIGCDKITVLDADILVVETFSENWYAKHFLTTTNDGPQVVFTLKSNQSEQITPLVYKDQQCFLLYTSYYNNLALQCMKLSLDGTADLYKELIIYTKDIVLQALTIDESQFVVSTPTELHIWDLTQRMIPIAVIPITNPVSMVFEKFDGAYYLAVTSNGHNIEIFRSFDASTYSHVQTIQVHNVIEMKFTTITASQDFLLYVLTSDYVQPLNGYAYRGIVGFQKFFNPINLKSAKRFDSFLLRGLDKYFVTYETNNGVQFYEAIIPYV